MIDLHEFAAQVGTSDPVSVTGLGTRGGPVAGVRSVTPPAGIEWIQPDEMVVSCGAATPIDELTAALADHGQTVALPPGGTVGGALAVGRSDVKRLGRGPVRDVLLQARYVSAAGEVVKVGGPTVKNVSGFDLCRLLVGSYGTLGFLGDVLLRTRPIPLHSQWFTDGSADVTRVQSIFGSLYRPTSVLWNGSRVWVLLEGHPTDVHEQAAGVGLVATDHAPDLPTARRSSRSPAAVWGLDPAIDGPFVAEVGVGVVHSAQAPKGSEPLHDRLAALTRAVEQQFDPTGRLNPVFGPTDGPRRASQRG